MAYYQNTITLPAHARGVHIITPYIEQTINELLPKNVEAGMVNL